jgi:mono/diheme cytochrome c family protein
MRLLPLLALAAILPAAEPAAPVTWTAVQPIFAANCVECHGPDKAKEKLRLDSHAAVMKGSKHGAVLTPGTPAASTLLSCLTAPEGDDKRMPPEGKGLSKEQIDLVRRWIAAGAPQ